MPQFLQLMTTNLLNINKGLNVAVTLKSVLNPTSSSASETVKSGEITESAYLTLAQTIVNYFNTNGKAPSTVTTSLGTMNFSNLVYSFSKILNFQNSNNRLPNYVSVVPWSSIPSSGEGSGSSSTSVTSILNTIGKEEAKFADVQGVTYNGLDDANVLVHYGYGDCSADSSWLYNQLNAAGISARIMGYANAPASSTWYRHAWVQNRHK